MYRTFLRSARNFKELASAEKIEVETGLTLEEARTACAEHRANRTYAEELAGTRLEFEEE